MSDFRCVSISLDHQVFSEIQRSRLRRLHVATVDFIGEPGLLSGNLLGLVCSVRCPGKIILETYDFMTNLRKQDITVISGFHSPMERECLNILMKGRARVIVCLARSMKKIRIPSEWKTPVQENRMLLLSMFPSRATRGTAQTAERRNLCVGALAGEVLVPYAATGSRTASLVENFKASGISVRGLEVGM